MQGRFREQEALVGACCITRGKVLDAVEERERRIREGGGNAPLPPSQQQNPLSGWKVTLTWYFDFFSYNNCLESHLAGLWLGAAAP